MIITYANIDNKLFKKEISAGDSIPKNTVWIDLLEPTREEERYIEKSLKIEAPTREEMDKIEVLSPFYKEGDAYYMTVTVLHRPENDPDSSAITFILTPQQLVSVRYSRPRSIYNFATRAMIKPQMCSTPEGTFEGLIDSLTNKIAETLEKAGNELDTTLKNIFEKKTEPNKSGRKAANQFHTTKYFNDVIKKIGRTGNVISKNRESLLSINRMLIFYSQIDSLNHVPHRENVPRFKIVSREVVSLSEYANFLSQRISFLLDATLGMLSVEQNSIIKVFTVATAGFMPPTLIASMYGMNFKHMPELNWQYGYPLTISLIIVSALVPYYYFKKKGWI